MAARGLVLLSSTLLLPALAPPATGQGQWMDVGSGASYTIAAENDPRSFERFPAFAFGDYPPGNLVYAELLPWPCSGLPSTEVCASGRFVAAFNGNLDTGSCDCSGFLVHPVYLELHYDPARVLALGAREEDLRLTLYDHALGEWVEIADQQVAPALDVVAGSHTGHARQYYAVLVRSQEGEDTTWGRVKGQWSRR